MCQNECQNHQKSLQKCDLESRHVLRALLCWFWHPSILKNVQTRMKGSQIQHFCVFRFWSDFWPILSQFWLHFWPILSQFWFNFRNVFLLVFWPILSQFWHHFWDIWGALGSPLAPFLVTLAPKSPQGMPKCRQDPPKTSILSIFGAQAPPKTSILNIFGSQRDH